MNERIKKGMLALFAFLLLAAALLSEKKPEKELPGTMFIAPSVSNGFPVQINLFAVSAGDDPASYELYLPGNADPADCFLSWTDGSKVYLDGEQYESGALPVPAAGETLTYSYLKGSEPVDFRIGTWRGSEKVRPVYIVIDESHGPVAAMDNDPDHNTSCTGTIFIDGEKIALDRIKGRGNYTWTKAKDKRSYNLTLGEKYKIPGIDCEATGEWIILSEIGDHSLLSNRSGYTLAHQLGIGLDCTSVDVWMNGEYQGCYTLTPGYEAFVAKDGYLIENDNNKVDRGMYIGGDLQFTLDGLYGPGKKRAGFNLITVKKLGDNLLFSGSGEVNKEVAANIRAWLQDAWDAIRSADGHNSKGKHYTEYIDIESFARMYLLHEYVKSYDICAGSILFHRDGQTDGDKLIAGPIWDLDNAMGSTLNNSDLGPVGDRRSGRGDFIPMINEYKTSVFKTLGRHEDFMKEVFHQYDLNHAYFENLPNVVRDMISSIEASAMMNHNKVEFISYNIHSYARNTTLEVGTEYEQNMQATRDSKNDWPAYANNLLEYVKARSLWFSSNYSCAE